MYAGMFVLKKLDLKPKDGGEEIPVAAGMNAAIEDVLDELTVHDYITINKRKRRYELTAKGTQYIGALIKEAEAYVDEFDDEDVEDMVEELVRRNIDVFRVRFLWGWYQNEFDDVVLFQQRRGFPSIERYWQNFIMDDAFYENLALDLED
ncbi:MAG: hypothetical protein H6713_03190 [Myxococcales bacterium]|nr:hypothetical protein [Myxococcales bacterium]MCB9748994.1 hypothetical protein [Myxococcales bacterium]